MVKRLLLANLLLAPLLASCTDTSVSAPYRAEVLVRDDAHRYAIETVDLPDLASLSPMADPRMRFSDHPHFSEDELEDYGVATFATASDYSPRVRDVGGVAVARDIESLLVMSAYHVLTDTFARATEVYGSLDQLIPDGGFQILVEPKFSSDLGTEELGTNAAYISGGQAFLLVQMSSLEQVPLGMNPTVLAHEFGHHVFQITFGVADGTCHPGSPEPGPTPPGRFAATFAISGFNEGFADFTAFALQEDTHVLADSLPGLDNGERTIDKRQPGYLDFTYGTIDRCGDSFYCIGTLWARAVYETYLSTGASASDLAARSAYARTIATAVAGIPARLRQRSGWPTPTEACDVTDLDDDTRVIQAYLEDFLAGLPVTLQPRMCAELEDRFGLSLAGCP